MHNPPTKTANCTWALKGRVKSTDDVQLFCVDSSPFRIGRRSELSLSIPHTTVSGTHAEMYLRGQQLLLSDLNSTNGTYVNGIPTRLEQSLDEGDLIQFADVAFRVCRDISESNRNVTVSASGACDRAFALMQFDRLMDHHAVVPHFQPIVTLPDQVTIGYEVLGRSKMFGLETPKDMFLAASQLNLEAELSRMFRMEGISKGTRLPETLNLFVNTHPVEVVNCGLLESLAELRIVNPGQAITLEIHEAAVTDIEQMKRLRYELNELNMQLAYDDFGAGQSRLTELVSVRPDFLKFDMHMIRNIHLAPERQVKMPAALIEIARDLGVTTLAEGIETIEEHEKCSELRFELAQGYFYGQPASIATVSADVDEGALVV